jgi:serologically defined colon cancer antigen 8
MAEMRRKFEEDKSAIATEIQTIEQQKRQTIADLEAETRMWEEKYNNREARPEDLDRIKKLETLIRERSEAIEKVQQELKHYQSELMNRETAYNKVFNNRPQVAVLSALERRAKRDQMIASVTGSVSMPLPPLPASKADSPMAPGKA